MHDIFLCFQLGNLHATRAFLIIGLLLYVLAFVLLTIAQFLKNEMFQKLILPVFFSIGKTTFFMCLSLQFAIIIYNKFFNVLCFAKFENRPISNGFLVSYHFPKILRTGHL